MQTLWARGLSELRFLQCVTCKATAVLFKGTLNSLSLGRTRGVAGLRLAVAGWEAAIESRQPAAWLWTEPGLLGVFGVRP